MKFGIGWKFKFLILLMLLTSFACSSQKFASNMAMDERYAEAMKLFEKGEYLEAKTQFTILVLNYPGTKIADKAQFYLAESHYGLKEYIIAAAEYEKLGRNYPQSEFVDDAQYKIGLSYYSLSPGYALDQNYTLQAVKEFQKFLEEFPTSDIRPKVEKLLTASRNKLAKKEFKAANLYRKLGYYRSANIYFDEFLKVYYDTDFAEEALFRKGECLNKLEDWEEAQKTFEEFIEKYPNSKFNPLVYDSLNLIKSKIPTNGGK